MGPKNKKQFVQIQNNTSQASATTVACNCTIEMGQKSKVQQATYMLFSIKFFSPVLFMQFVPQPFVFIHSSLNSVLKHLEPVGQRKQKF